MLFLKKNRLKIRKIKVVANELALLIALHELDNFQICVKDEYDLIKNSMSYLLNDIDFDGDEMCFDSYSGIILGNNYIVSNFEIDYDTSRNGVYFKNDTIRYSYGVTPIEVKSYILKVPVYIMGTISDEARPIPYQIVTEGTDAISGEQYNIHDALIYPDSVSGFIPVEILRDGLKGSYAEGYTHYNLKLRLVQNNSFIPTLTEKEQEIVLIFHL